MIRKDIVVQGDLTVKAAMKVLDKTAEKTLLITGADGSLAGVMTDGDVRRYILQGKSLDRPIKGMYNAKPLTIKADEVNADKARDLFLTHKIMVIPVVDARNILSDILVWDDVFSGESKRPVRKKGDLGVPVIIMAGGKGTRMEPFTQVLPKPLIPIGGQTILEKIFDQFISYGVKSFLVTLNYKREMVEAYFKGIRKDYRLTYLRETDYFGTAGSILLAARYIKDTFIVSNCDIIVRADYADALAFHRKNNAVLTIVSSIQHHVVPYGVIDFAQGGQVTAIREKPELTFTINTGVYIMQKECLSYIPRRIVCNMNTLIENLIADGKKVLIYPVNENDYLDIGQWEEYRKAVQKIDLMS